MVAAFTVALGGCGSGTKLLHAPTGHPSAHSSTGVPVAAVRVIVGWSDALRAGHVAAAARYFSIPNRPGPGGAGGCGSGVGGTARTNILVRDGRIVEWLRAPDEPGDNGSPRTAPLPPTTQTAPGATPGGGIPVV